MLQIQVPYKKKWELSESLDTEGKKVLRVPIAVLGEWKHPEYGDVKFTQSDFDQIKQNWSTNVTGYEPPLFLGHPVNTETREGAPAIGFLERIYQEDDVLFGEHEPVDDQVYEDVAKGKWRYSSAEIVRNATSKETGEKIGTLLVGTALTNRPFLTNMPRVEAGVQQFSESGTETSLFSIAITADPTPKQMDQQNQNAPAPAGIDLEKFSDLVRTVEELGTKLEATQAELAEARAQLKDQKLAEQLSEVNALNLTSAVKEKYSDMLKSGSLPESQQEEVMALLRQLSDDNKQVFSEARGAQEADVQKAADVKIENPFEEVIKKNYELAEKMQTQVL